MGRYAQPVLRPNLKCGIGSRGWYRTRKVTVMAFRSEAGIAAAKAQAAP